MERKLRVAVAGLGFGAEFVPIYQAHPDVEAVGICDPNADVPARVGARHGIARRLTDLGAVLGDEFVRSIIERRPPAIDAVTAANWTAAGICAHQSAMAGGDGIDIPRFDEI